MKLKTYQARSMSEALSRVRMDLGRDAVILHTRSIKRGGLFGFGAKSLVEITAAATCGTGVPPVAPPPRRRCHATAAVDRRVPPSPRLAVSPSRGNADPALRREVEEIRCMVRDLLRQTGRGDPGTSPDVPDELIAHYTHLIGQDVAEELANRIVRRVSRRIEERGASYWDEHGRLVDGVRGSGDRVREALLACVTEMVPPAEPLKLSAADRPTVVALVGPTGVGKTTTIAKLAANMKLREAKRVGLITIDTFRIAAVEQLKTYAQIMDVPLTAVLTPEEMAAALRRMSNLDLILIDTAGRSQKDAPRIAELQAFLSAARPDQVHLVLSSTSREEALREAVRSFSVLGARHVVFTKLDEAVGFGVMLNVLQSVDMRLSFLTNGQSVPDAIEVGSARRVAELVLGSEGEPAARPHEPAPSLQAADGRGGA